MPAVPAARQRARALLSRGRDVASQLRYVRTVGLQTAERRDLAELGFDDDELTFYEAAEWGLLRRALPRNEVAPDDVLLDIGCGLGRVLLVASRYPFRRIIGVELASELAETARQNLRRARADHVEVVVADATAWPVPDDVTIVFMNNPFTGQTFSRVLDQILASIDRRRRTVRLLYRNPLEQERVLATGRAREVGRTYGGPRWRRAGGGVITYVLE